MIKTLDFVIFWAIVILPFMMGMAMAPMNVFMGFLIFAFLMKKAVTRQRLFAPTAIDWALLAFFLISMISIFNSVSFRDSFRGMTKLLYSAAVCLILAEEIKTKRHLRYIAIAMIIGVSVVGFDSLWQVIFGKDLFRGSDVIINLGLRRATGVFSDSNVLGIYLSAFLPLTMILAPWVSLLGLSGAFLTYSRPTYLALYAALWIIGLVKKSRVLIIALIAAAILSPFAMPKSIKDWAREVEYNPLRFMCNDDRIAVYRNSLNMISHHPLIGVGVNTYMKNYKTYKESPEYRNVVTSDNMYAHNNFLQMAGEVGITGLLIFFWLLYLLFKSAVCAHKKLSDPFVKQVSLGAIACLAAFLVNGLTESSLYYSRVSLVFWYLMGFSLALRKFSDADKT